MKFVNIAVAALLFVCTAPLAVKAGAYFGLLIGTPRALY